MIHRPCTLAFILLLALSGGTSLASEPSPAPADAKKASTEDKADDDGPRLRLSPGIEVFAGAAALVVVDAALWFQWPERPDVDFVLGVRAPLSVRVERIRARDHINEAAAVHRVRRQKAIEASLDRSDAVLDTADAPEMVRRRLLEILDEHLGLDLVGTDPA